MINLTRDIIFLKHGDELTLEIKDILSMVYECELKHANSYKSDNKRHYQEKQYSDKCNPNKYNSELSSEDFVIALDYSVCYYKHTKSISAISKTNNALKWFEDAKVQGNYLPSIRRAFARILFELWSRGCILLTATFPLMTYYSTFQQRNISLEDGSIFKSLIDVYINDGPDSETTKQFASHTLSILLMTDWNDSSSEFIDDLSEHYVEKKRLLSGEESILPKSRTYYTRIIDHINEVFGNELDSNEIESFKYWVKATKWNKEYTFRKFYENKEQLLKQQETHHILRRRGNVGKWLESKAAEIISDYNDKKITMLETIERLTKDEKVFCLDVVQDFLMQNKVQKDLAEHKATRSILPNSKSLFALLANTGEVEEYFAEYQYVRRDREWYKNPYPGREHVEIYNSSESWRKLLSAWYKHRDSEGYEDKKIQTKAERFILDYIFLYLPFWIEVNPETTIKLPYTPEDFDRYTFVHRDYLEDNNDLLPGTLYELLRQRYPNVDTAYSIFSSIRIFFQYLSRKRITFKGLLGDKWINPIEETDKFKTKRKNKTVKVAFEEEASPWILRYFYALNSYGEYLQELALKDDYFSDRKNIKIKSGFILGKLCTNRMINTQNEYGGNVPIIKGYDIYGEYREIELLEIPNVFQFAKRTIVKDGVEVEVILPHLTMLRVNIMMYEVGRRNSNARHIDSNTWDSLNEGKGNEEPIFQLNINTDKNLEIGEIKSAPMLKRLRDILLKEEAFQNMVAQGSPELVSYLDREETRFDDLLPLFKSATVEKPVSDSSVRSTFKWMVGGAQETLNINNISDIPFAWVNYNKEDNTVSCPKEMNTHTFRSNFITHRMPYFPDDVNELVSHANMAVSGHYYSPSNRDMERKFIEADKSIHGFTNKGSITKSFDGSSHIHASNPFSALQQSWGVDKNETIKRFNFVMTNGMPGVTDKDMKDGLDLLRTSPTSQVKFLDTHVCPVNLKCPNNIIDAIGESHRCGICPIAGKCVDHMPAIRAEMRSLGERIKRTKLLAKKYRAESRGDGEIRKLQEQVQIDSLEFSGWQATEIYLSKALELSKENDKDVWHIQMPEMVKFHLEEVIPESSEQSYLLERIAAAEAYPSVIQKDTTLEAKAKMFALKIASNQGVLEEALDLLGKDIDAIDVITSQLKVLLKTKGIEAKDVYKKLQLDDKYKAILPSAFVKANGEEV